MMVIWTQILIAKRREAYKSIRDTLEIEPISFTDGFNAGGVEIGKIMNNSYLIDE